MVVAGNILLFVDEIHNIMGMGSAEGARRSPQIHRIHSSAFQGCRFT